MILKSCPFCGIDILDANYPEDHRPECWFFVRFRHEFLNDSSRLATSEEIDHAWNIRREDAEIARLKAENERLSALPRNIQLPDNHSIIRRCEGCGRVTEVPNVMSLVQITSCPACKAEAELAELAELRRKYDLMLQHGAKEILEYTDEDLMKWWPACCVSRKPCGWRGLSDKVVFVPGDMRCPNCGGLAGEDKFVSKDFRKVREEAGK